MENFIVSFGIPLAYIAFGIAVLGIIVFSVLQMLQDLNKAKTALMGIGIMVFLFLICFMLADRQEFTVGEIYVPAGQMKVVEASMYSFYMLLLVSILAIAYSSVSRYFKK